MTIHHEQIAMNIRRAPNTGLGISIAGGIGSTPFKANDYVRDSPLLNRKGLTSVCLQGIFLMKVNPEGPAAHAGLLVGDKLLSVNGVSLIHCEHGKAVAALKTAGDHFPMIVMREILSSTSTSASPSDEHLRMKQGEKYSTIVEQDGGQFGFSLAGGSSSTTTNETQNLYISSVKDSDASQSLAIGDRLLSINGHETSSISHDQAVEMIKNGGNQLELLLYREKPLDGTTKPSIDHTIEVSQRDDPTVRLRRIRFQEAHVVKGSGPMGLSIVGGTDQACAPFGKDQRGVFVSKVS